MNTNKTPKNGGPAWIIAAFREVFTLKNNTNPAPIMQDDANIMSVNAIVELRPSVVTPIVAPKARKRL